MPEGMNVEISRKLTEQEEKEKRKTRWEVLIEIVEVAVLAIVAVATAWSGYAAARWDGQQSLLYGHAPADRFIADAASTYGGQELAADSAMFTAYLQARSAGDSKLKTLYVRRFTPDYRAAFAAWLKTDPFSNSAAPAGPGVMPQYRNPSFESAARLNALASATFTQGSAARGTAERYVRDTVLRCQPDLRSRSDVLAVRDATGDGDSRGAAEIIGAGALGTPRHAVLAVRAGKPGDDIAGQRGSGAQGRH